MAGQAIQRAVGQTLAQLRPARAVPLRRVCGVDLAVAKQVGVELGLDRADRHEAAVRGFVEVVEGSARAAAVVPG
jgi:hypothetical protein